MRLLLRWLLQIATWPLRWRFERSCQSPRAAQTKVLERLASAIAQTDYGQHYGVVDAASFRNKLPVVDYEALEPWLERQREKESQAIVPGRVILYEKTSGSSGPAKYIPYNRAIRWSFTRMFLLWASNVANSIDRFGEGKLYFSVSPSFGEREVTHQGRQVGLEDDRDYLSGPVRWLVNAFLVESPGREETSTPEAFKAAVVKRLLATKDLESISVWNPSFLTMLLDWAVEARETLSRENLLWDAEPARREAFCEDPPRWTEVWPKLKFISTWSDANARPLADGLRQEFPGVYVQGKGLLATEAPMTIPWFKVVGGVPLVDDVYFEFENDSGELFELHELALDHCYEVIISQAAGLCRYRMRDIVRVVGFFGETPTLEFLGRGNRVSDLVGEKLNETFVGKVLDSVLTGKSRYRMLVPTQIDRRRYILLVDQIDSSPLEVGAAVEAELAKAYHYNHARILGQLDAVEVVVDESAAEKMGAFYQRNGLKLGDIKQGYLAVRLADASLLESLKGTSAS